MIREALSSLARRPNLGDLISRTPIARDVVSRLVGGDTVDDAIAVASELADRGLWVSLERAAPASAGDEAAAGLLAEHVTLVHRLTDAGLGGVSEVAVFAAALDPLGGSAPRLTELAQAATTAGIIVMLDMGPPEQVDRTLDLATCLRDSGLLVGVTIQANLLRSEADCARLSGVHVRLVKGAHRAPPDVAHPQPAEIDKAFVRCAKTLLRGDGEPSFATHDPHLIEVVETVARRFGRPPQTFEFCFYLGRQDAAQDRLSSSGNRVRVYVPYGPDWFGRLVGGLAEQPTSIAGAVRSLLPGGGSAHADRPPEEE